MTKETRGTSRPSGYTDPSSVIAQKMRECHPVLRIKDVRQVAFYVFRIRVCRKPQPSAEAHNMRIHGKCRAAERITQHHIGRLSADAWQLEKFVHRVGYLLIKPIDQHPASVSNVTGLVTIKTGRANRLLQFGQLCARKGLDRRVPPEQRVPNCVHTFVCTLGRHDRFDQQLKGCVRDEVAGRFGVCCTECSDNAAKTMPDRCPRSRDGTTFDDGIHPVKYKGDRRSVSTYF